MERHANGTIITQTIKESYFLIIFVFLKSNAIQQFILWMILIVDYAEILIVIINIDLLEELIVFMKAYLMMKEWLFITLICFYWFVIADLF